MKKPKYEKLKDGIWDLYVANDVVTNGYQIWVTKLAHRLWQWSVFATYGKAIERGKASSLVLAKRAAEHYLKSKVNNG